MSESIPCPGRVRVSVPCMEKMTNEYHYHTASLEERPAQFYKEGQFELHDGRYYLTRDPEAWALWHSESLPEGYYDVQVWFPASDDAGKALYTLYSEDGTEQVTVDQQGNGGGWIHVGSTHRFSPGVNAVTVRFDGNTGGTLAVGNVRFDPAQEPAGTSTAPYDAPAALSVLDIRPTALFRCDPADALGRRLLQLVQTKLMVTGAPAALTLEIRHDGETVSMVPLGRRMGLVLAEAYMPDINRQTQGEFIFRDEADGRVLARQQITLTPAPKYTIYYMETAHNDLGYEHSVPDKADYWADWVDEAIELIEKHTHPENPDLNYNYWFEHLWQLILYAKLRPREQVDKIRRLFEQKRLSTGAIFTSCHGQWGEIEQTARMPYALKQEVKEHLGIDIGGICVNTDNPTISWDTVRSVAAAGYQGVLLNSSAWRGYSYLDTFRKNNMQNLFYWRLPDGEGRLPALINTSYTGGMNLHYDYCTDESFSHGRIDSQIRDYVETGGTRYPYDAIFTCNYYDNESPNEYAYGFIRDHNQRFAYPVFKHNAPPEDFFSHVFDKYGEKGQDIIPTYGGEINNFSGDYCTINVNAYSAKTRAAHLTRAAETLACAASAADPAFRYPYEQYYRQYMRFNEFDEHCYPTGPEYGDFQYYSTLYYKTRGATDFMLPEAQNLLSGAASALAARIPAGKGTLAVFNPLCHRRGDVVALDAPAGWEALRLRSLSTGALVPCQRTHDRRWIFHAEDLPSLGYEVYAMEPEPVKPCRPQTVFAGSKLENRFYAVTFDGEGGITGILDKQTGRELVRPGSIFNQFLFRRYIPGQSAQFTQYTAAGSPPELVESGPVRTVVRVRSMEAQSGADIEQFVILYEDIKRIDFHNTLREVEAMYEPFTADYYSNMDVRYRNNMFYGFPLNMDDPQFHACTAGEIVFNPYDGQDEIWDRAAIKDFITLHNWVHVSDGELGVTLYSPDAPTIMCGDITYNHFSTEMAKGGADLYSYFQSARIGANGFLSHEEANFEVRYSIVSGRGDCAAQKSDLTGREIALPAFACPAGTGGNLPSPSHSLLKVSHDNVALSVLKKSEQPGEGVILRLYETRGQAVDQGFVDFGLFPTSSAYVTDGAEQKERPLPLDGGRIPFRIGKFGTLTLRVYGACRPGEVKNLRACAISDGEANLAWDPADNADGYLIYRDTAPEYTPDPYRLAGYTGEPCFTDHGQVHFAAFEGAGFGPGKTFHYTVRAINGHNNLGPCSATVPVTLGCRNDTPPAPVKGLMAMQLKNLAGTYRVAVQWEKSPETDTMVYVIHRSTRQGFTPSDRTKASPFFYKPQFRGAYMEVYIDQFMLEPGATYYYKVCPVDSAGNVQKDSPEAALYVRPL